MIRRAPRTGKFTVVPLGMINDEKLAADALGLLVYLVSKPDYWSVRVNHLQIRFGCGKDRVYRMLGDLRAAGYAHYTKFADGTTEWTIADTPGHDAETVDTTPYAENPDQEKPHQENPDQEKPDDIDNIERAVNTENSSNTEEKQYRSNAALFDRWWSAYPKKIGKKTALAIWKRRKLDTIAESLIIDVETRKAQCQKWKGGFIPNPSTYLNGDRWEDQIETTSTTTRETHADRQLRIIRDLAL